MLTVIFGAGASYDSDPDNPAGSVQVVVNQMNRHRPPLANELFQARPNFIADLKRFPECFAIVPWLRHLSVPSIEEMLERLYDEAQHPMRPNVERTKQLAAVRFYLQTVIEGCARHWHLNDFGNSNYLTLLDYIRHCGNTAVCLITFNYDQLIDLNLERLTGVSPNTLPEYLAWERFALYKVHGSVNWGRVVQNHNTYAGNPQDVIVAALIQNAAQLEFTNDYRLVKNSRVPIVNDGDDVLVPAVAVPIQTKQAFE